MWQGLYTYTEAEFLYIMETKVFILAIHCRLYTNGLTPPPPPLQENGMKLCCDVNIVYGNLESENSQDYAQKPQRNCTFMNSTSGLFGGN
jgi:hypothetical protein